ncbi:hypothetical protein ACOMHN_027914 [Nucella lapillus]
MKMGGHLTDLPSSSPLLLTVMLVVVTCWAGVGADRGGREAGGQEQGGCGRGRAVGDKWFDGCQWCVCTAQGHSCSSSTCSSLVKQVPACHVTGQRWTDGCYRCQCRRHGITCRLDVTCDSLRQQPVPCLADERCVCGPDGVPSCTAGVIDRNAFAAKRVHLGFPHGMRSKGFQDSYRGRYSGIRSNSDHVTRRHRNDRRPLFLPGSQQTAADQLRRAGLPHNPDGKNILSSASKFRLRQRRVTSPHASYRGRRSAEPSTQELLITSDNLCRFGARWYGGSLRCFCDLEGAIACGNPVFVLAFFDDFRVESKPCEEGHTWEDGCRVCTCQVNGVIFCRSSQSCGQGRFFPGDGDQDSRLGPDRYITAFPEHSAGDSEENSGVFPSTVRPWRKEPQVPDAQCMPGTQWKRGCVRCRCTRHGRQVCSRRHCGVAEVDAHLPSYDREDGRHKPPPPGNKAKLNPPTLGPPFKRFRGPMMVVPKPPGSFHLPAYASKPARPLKVQRCGRFPVGMKYWDDCNLCLCTSRGPRCQGKLCR